MIVLLFGAALLFATAGWVGTYVGTMLCAQRVPFADGPAPTDPPRWSFAAVAACVGAAAAAQGDAPLHLLALALVAVSLSACAFSDLRVGIVPDVCTFIPLFAIVVGSLWWRHDPLPTVSAAFVALPFAVAALLSRGIAMGWGDVKLAALTGALLGAPDATLALTGACAAAYLVAVVRRRAEKLVAFAPYMVAAVAVALAVHPTR